MVAEALSGRDEIVEIVTFPRLLAGHGFPLAGQFGRIGLSGLGIVGKDVFEAGVQLLAEICGAVAIPVVAVGRHRGGSLRAFSVRVTETLSLCRGIAAQIAIVCRNFQQWIALHLLRNELRQLEMRHLKQLDGLHQLRCHHERLVLTQQKAGRQCHGGRETPLTASPSPDFPEILLRRRNLAQKLLFYLIWSSVRAGRDEESFARRS